MRMQVIRTHTSPYQAEDFLQREKSLIENIEGMEYRALKDAIDLPTVLITNTHTQLKELPPQILKNTKLIIHPNSGYDHFAPEVEIWKSIPLVVGHTIRAQAVAEYSLGAVFQGLVELPQHVTWQKKREWNRTLLKGTPVCVFGYGHIGKVIADTLAILGMKVTVIDPYIEQCPHNRTANLKEARVVIAACSLNETSKNMFNESFFSKLGDEVLFINGARGKLVDEKALREYLLSHPESFAFLDVFEKEPFTDDWHGFPQVWKTSHIAGVEKDLDQKILNFELGVLKDYLSNSQFLDKYKKELLQNKWIKGVLV